MMSLSNGKIERDWASTVRRLRDIGMGYLVEWSATKPWAMKKRSDRYQKQQKARLERRQARADPECDPGYGRYNGWS